MRPGDRTTRIELQSSRDPVGVSEDGPEMATTTSTTSLPPADGGRQAYLVLLGCSLLQLPVWGFAVSYGVFQDYYTSDTAAEKFGGDINAVGVIGTTLNGILYISMPIFFGLFSRRWIMYRRHAALFGTVLSVSSLVLSSFATQVWQLVITQGILQAIGSTILFCSTTIFIDEWFARRKGFSFGVMLSSKGAVGGFTPLFFGFLLPRLGYRNTTRLWAGLVLASALPSFFLLRHRIAPQNEPRRTRRLSWKFLHHPTFYIFSGANIIFAASYGMPNTYLSNFATNVLHLSPSNSALILAALNAPSIVASVSFGLLSDGATVFRGQSLGISTVSLLSAGGACLTAFLFWGLIPGQSAGGVALLVLFAITYGFFAGGYSATWGGIIKELQREAEAHNEPVDTSLIYGLLNGGRGIGFVVGGFIGVELLNVGALNTSHWAYGSKFGSLILFTGIGAAFAASCVRWKNPKLWLSRCL